MIQDNPTLVKWSIYGFSQNPNITFDIIKNNLHRGWCWISLTTIPAITLDTILDSKDPRWDWENVIRHKSFSREVVEKELNNAATKIQRWFSKIIFFL